MPEHLSKTAMVRICLLWGQSLTQREAIEAFANYRLASSIHALKREGLLIENVHEGQHPASGSRMWARYRIPPHALPSMRKKFARLPDK